MVWPQVVTWWDELNPRVRCAFGNVFLIFSPFLNFIWTPDPSKARQLPLNPTQPSSNAVAKGQIVLMMIRMWIGMGMILMVMVNPILKRCICKSLFAKAGNLKLLSSLHKNSSLSNLESCATFVRAFNIWPVGKSFAQPEVDWIDNILFFAFDVEGGFYKINILYNTLHPLCSTTSRRVMTKADNCWYGRIGCLEYGQHT